ncbi:putative mannan endo-1,4-beta-mannosidase A-1 [Lineolata rhizophorae]|uniref:mannan endo-1,4-beta-mannosidase n=1 Tax=Lineolata rhizophorae TaxID=578093 RepID=A0A6A6P969_9PEZI|nr:putative mannan endo-1,4-beta-mannosidase A-1 [Lineolata rhizophorae]
MKFSKIFCPAGLAASAAAQADFPSTDGTLFNIDGVTDYYAGTNSYWISMTMNDNDVNLVMDHLEESGLRVLRIWGFADVNQVPGSNTVWFQSFVNGQQPQINTGANGLQRLDSIVRAAETRGVKLIINFVNFWDDYGGMQAYMNYYGGSKTDFYTNSEAQAQYRNYIEAVVSRFSDSPAIFAWELANEPRCPGCDTSVLHTWASDISAYIKSLDPDHMVTLGDEGMGLTGGDGSYPYQYTEGSDWEAALDIETLDFATFHYYPSSWGLALDGPTGQAWVENHARLCAAAGKPCLFEEYGLPNNHCDEAAWQETSAESEGMGGDLFWQLGDTLSTGQTHDDTYTIYYNSADWQCVVEAHQDRIGARTSNLP